jgi:hypothetical protein
MARRPAPALILAGAALTTLAVLPGCLVTSESSESYTGNRVEPGEAQRVRPGRTTVDQAVAILGEPSESAVAANGEEILTWRWTKRAASSGSVFLIFSGSSNKTEDHALHVAFRDGVAVRKWRE